MSTRASAKISCVATTDGADSQCRQGGYPEDVFDRLAALEPGHFWFEGRNDLIVWAIQKYFPDATTFLDVGCGTGFVLEGISRSLPRLKLAAVERANGGLAVARRRVPSADFTQQDVRELPQDQQVDLAGMFDVLEHVEDDRGVLERLHRIVKPGGGLLITVPQHPWLWSEQDDFGQHVRRYRRRELAQRVTEAGFEVIRLTSFVSLPLPWMAFSRLVMGSRTTGSDPFRELEIAPMTNLMMRGLLASERALIKAGVSWPAGGSLLAAARRHD